jgi:hypothetical protein
MDIDSESTRTPAAAAVPIRIPVIVRPAVPTRILRDYKQGCASFIRSAHASSSLCSSYACTCSGFPCAWTVSVACLQHLLESLVFLKALPPLDPLAKPNLHRIIKRSIVIIIAPE